MRLVFVIEHFSPATGGAEGMAVAAVRGLLQRGHDVQVVARDGRPIDGCPLHLLPVEKHAATARALGGLVVDWGLSVPADVHRLGGGLTQVFQRYNALSRRPEIRWLKRFLDRVSVRQRRSIRLEAELLRRPQARFIAVSQFVARQVTECCPAAAARVEVVYNGVDVQRFCPENRARWRSAVRRDWGVPDDAVLFLFVAHNPRLKNIQLLTRLFQVLHAQAPQARLVVVGKHRVPCRGAPWLLTAGATESPEQLYAAADVLLHPTLYDACANVVLEGLASGLIVASSDLNGSAELMTSGIDGFVLPVQGLQPAHILADWMQLVRWLATDTALRERLGKNARKLAEAHSMDAWIAALEASLQRAAG